MLQLVHILIILFVSLVSYVFFSRPTIVNTQMENFDSHDINYHNGDDYNIINQDNDI